jgi:adenylate cyclase
MTDIKRPSKTEILDQLVKILQSEDFQRSARSSKFLEFVTNKALEGEQDQIKGYTIGIEVFGKPEDFDPDTDASVRVEATRLRKSLTLYYHGAGKNDPVTIKIGKGGYIPTFYYNTPESVPKGEDIPTSSTLSLKTRARMMQGIVFLCFVLSVFVALMWYATSASKKVTPHALPIVAVLPFAALGDADTKDFSETLSTQILNNLTRFDSIKALGANNVAGAQNWRGASAEIGAKLHANYVIEGTVEKKLNDVFLSLRLLDLQKTTYVWSFKTSYNAENGEISDWKTDTAGSIASQLASPYGIIQNLEQERMTNSDDPSTRAYRCTLDYYAYCNHKTDEGRGKVRTCLERTVKDNPNDSTAWAYLSWIYGDEYRYAKVKSVNGVPPQQASLQAAEKSVSIDPKNPRSHQYFSIAAVLNKNEDLARQHLNISVSLNPYDSEILADAGWNYAQIGDWEASKPVAEKSIQYNPGHARWYYGALFAYHYEKGSYDEALRYALEYYSPDEFYSSLALAVSYAGTNRMDEAQAVVKAVEKNHPKFLKDPRKSIESLSFQESFIEKLLIGAEAAGFNFPESEKTVPTHPEH